ncbi:MAG: hypothetical protein ACLGI9_06730 [Thermoanaerobaculia bacterium]
MRWQALIWIVGIASTFTFLSVFWWALQRRREREALYRHETARRLIERGEAERAIVWLREDEATAETRRREGLKLSALVWIATGLGVLIGLEKLQDDKAMLGWVPLLVGAALLLYSYFSRRRPS